MLQQDYEVPKGGLKPWGRYILIASTESSTATSWACNTQLGLMMRLKSFRPEVDKSWCVILQKSVDRWLS